MKTLVISDIHEDLPALDHWLSMMQDVDHTIFLGDWFDTFYTHMVEETITLLREMLEREDVTCLIGNHDAMYLFGGGNWSCSGYRPLTMHLVQAAQLPLERFGVFVAMPDDAILLSHAGVRPETAHFIAEEEGALATAIQRQFSDFWAAGYSRGGNVPYGGPTWLDWRELKPIPGWHQIVGHTYSKGEVREKDGNYCIDTGLQHAIIVEDGVIRVLERG